MTNLKNSVTSFESVTSNSFMVLHKVVCSLQFDLILEILKYNVIEALNVFLEQWFLAIFQNTSTECNKTKYIFHLC